MDKRLSLLLASCLASTGALAADGDWTGWHVGGHVGYGSSKSQAAIALGETWGSESQSLRELVVSSWSGDLDDSGTLWGLQFGYDHQFDNSLVLGAELDYGRLGLEDSRQTGPVPVPTVVGLSYDFGNTVELDDRLSLRARVGYASGPHLFYATAGWTQVDAQASASVASSDDYLKLGVASETLDGIEWGLGYEYDLGNQWTIRAEYLATHLDDLDYRTGYLPGSAFVDPPYLETVNQDLDFDAFRVGFSYRF